MLSKARMVCVVAIAPAHCEGRIRIRHRENYTSAWSNHPAHFTHEIYLLGNRYVLEYIKQQDDVELFAACLEISCCIGDKLAWLTETFAGSDLLRTDIDAMNVSKAKFSHRTESKAHSATNVKK